MNLQRVFSRLGLSLSARNFENLFTSVVLRRATIRDDILKIITTRTSRCRGKRLPQFTTLALLGFMKKKDDDKKENNPSLTSRKILLAKADALYDQGEYKAIYDLLRSDPRIAKILYPVLFELMNYSDPPTAFNFLQDMKDVEVLWRLCRAYYNMAKTASEVESKKLIEEGYELAVTALSIDDNHWAVHKWMAILLDAKNNLDGMKARLKHLYTVKDHMMKSVELNPNDATTLYMLGTWCYEITNLAWYQRQIVSTLFGKLPDSSFDEALVYYEAAEKVDPNFYSKNLLMLGKTYLKLKRKDEAFKYLKMASEHQAKNDEDQEVKKEALKLLNEI